MYTDSAIGANIKMISYWRKGTTRQWREKPWSLHVPVRTLVTNHNPLVTLKLKDTGGRLTNNFNVQYKPGKKQ